MGFGDMNGPATGLTNTVDNIVNTVSGNVGAPGMLPTAPGQTPEHVVAAYEASRRLQPTIQQLGREANENVFNKARGLGLGTVIDKHPTLSSILAQLGRSFGIISTPQDTYASALQAAQGQQTSNQMAARDTMRNGIKEIGTRLYSSGYKPLQDFAKDFLTLHYAQDITPQQRRQAAMNINKWFADVKTMGGKALEWKDKVIELRNAYADSIRSNQDPQTTEDMRQELIEAYNNWQLYARSGAALAAARDALASAKAARFTYNLDYGPDAQRRQMLLQQQQLARLQRAVRPVAPAVPVNNAAQQVAQYYGTASGNYA